jgi:tRNA (adenine22-N1)-methyltransferase
MLIIAKGFSSRFAYSLCAFTSIKGQPERAGHECLASRRAVPMLPWFCQTVKFQGGSLRGADENLSMLSARLEAVARHIAGPVHADIGTDHALLPRYLLEQGRVKRVIAVEKHPGPYARACLALQGYPAEVRRGDGLGPLQAHEAQSLSITGMGALNIVAILRAHPERLPDRLVIQAMDDCLPVRRWARVHGFHLKAEEWVDPHSVLTFQSARGPDPAYQDIPTEAALRFGPRLLGQPGARERLLSLRLWIEQQRDPRYFADLKDSLGQALEWLDLRECSD